MFAENNLFDNPNFRRINLKKWGHISVSGRENLAPTVSVICTNHFDLL